MFCIGAPFRRMKLFQIFCLSFFPLLFPFLYAPNIFAQDDLLLDLEAIEIPEIIPESDTEKNRYDGALRRRQLSLILAGRMKPEEATELKALFSNN